MPVQEHVAYVPYRELIQHYQQDHGWTCAICGGPVQSLLFGHPPNPTVPLFECEHCGRRSDGCQTFEGHHLLYQYCPLEERHSMRCGYWHSEWGRSHGLCPVCGGEKMTPAQ